MKERARNMKGQHHIKNIDNLFLGENLADFDRFKNDMGLDMKSDNVIKYSEKNRVMCFAKKLVKFTIVNTKMIIHTTVNTYQFSSVLPLIMLLTINSSDV